MNVGGAFLCLFCGFGLSNAFGHLEVSPIAMFAGSHPRLRRSKTRQADLSADLSALGAASPLSQNYYGTQQYRSQSPSKIAWV